jgi:hypothetical protein
MPRLQRKHATFLPDPVPHRHWRTVARHVWCLLSGCVRGDDRFESLCEIIFRTGKRLGRAVGERDLHREARPVREEGR